MCFKGARKSVCVCSCTCYLVRARTNNFAGPHNGLFDDSDLVLSDILQTRLVGVRIRFGVRRLSLILRVRVRG